MAAPSRQGRRKERLRVQPPSLSPKRQAPPAEEPVLAPLARRDMLYALALGAGALTLYLLTMAKDLWWGDSAELTLASATLGIAHPSGYPLFTLLGKALSLLPWGDLPARVNALSALSAALSVSVIYLLARSMASRPGALMAALAWGASLELWEQSSVAEVYALHALLTAGALLATLRAQHDPSRLPLVGLLLGLGFANHMTTFLNIPPIVALLLAGDRKGLWRIRTLAPTALAGLVGPALYLMLLVRAQQSPFIDYGHPATLSALWDHVTGAQFRYRILALSFAEVAGQVGGIALDFLKQFLASWPLILVGAVTLWRRRRPLAASLLGLAALHTLYGLNYNIPDKSGYFLAAYLPLALLAAPGLDALLQALKKPALAAIALALLPLPLWAGAVDKSENRSLTHFAQDVLATADEGLLLVEDQVLYFAMLHLEGQPGYGSKVIPVCEYLLRLPWYLDWLRQHRPGLVVPEELDNLIARNEAALKGADKIAYGQRSAEVMEQVKAGLVEANIGRMAVYLCTYEDKVWLERFRAYSLETLGLLYRFHEGEAPSRPYPIVAHPPEMYVKAEGANTKVRYVASRYATAYNRRGIIHARLKEPHKAVDNFQRALRYDPGYAFAYKNIGAVLYNDLNDRAGAAEAWGRFLELGVDDPDRGKIQEALGRMR